jgi:small conductance mechanosensitive channel
MAEQKTEKVADENVSAGEGVNALWDSLVDYFGSLDATELAINFALTITVAAFLTAALWAFRRYLHKGADRIIADTTAKQLYLRRLLALALVVVRLAILLFAIYLVARIWGVDLLAWSSSDQGASILKSALRLTFLLVAAIAANELAQLLVNHVIERVSRSAANRRRSLQLNTLGPLLRGLVQVVVLVIATLMVLGEIGVEIGPLIAGAGVIGIAVGFGAQTLVKDFLTGVFLIVEDVVSVGDIVRVGDSGGLVEKMTLRTLQLRDFDGTLHVLPYSEAQVVHNMTKTFSYYVFDILVAYECDVDHALDIMRRVGAEMQADKAFSNKILEPLEVVGVDGFADSGVKLKARFKTWPIEQWSVGREFNRRLKHAFDAEGITIPYPHVHIVAQPLEATQEGVRDNGRMDKLRSAGNKS